MSNGLISSKFLQKRNKQDGDLVSSNCIQTLDVACYLHQSYIGINRVKSTEDRIRWFWQTCSRARRTVVVVVGDIVMTVNAYTLSGAMALIDDIPIDKSLDNLN